MLASLNHPSSSSSVCAGRGLAYEGLGDWVAALADYDKALVLAEAAGQYQDPYVLNSRGNCHASLGEAAAAAGCDGGSGSGARVPVLIAGATGCLQSGLRCSYHCSNVLNWPCSTACRGVEGGEGELPGQLRGLPESQRLPLRPLHHPAPGRRHLRRQQCRSVLTSGISCLCIRQTTEWACAGKIGWLLHLFCGWLLK
jgi:hypothetical protein